MNAETLAPGRLAALLEGAAAGLLADTAAAGLIIAHGHFLHDPAFRRIIAAGSSVADGQPFAVIRWNAAVTALELGCLHATGSERAVLLIAASIAEGTPVSLRDCLGSLDRRNIALVTDAITAANR
ncbi:MAG: hypothetical protein ACRDN1_07515 [Trebonia sp.]